ncbi:MAG TPA: hypothetical protein VLV88_00880 [Terriglobales bacterium]|nr:hypothetical protein [Terriglobales bacterium]
MSVQAVHNTQQAAQTETAPGVQLAQKPPAHQNAIPEDKVTISAAAQAKQNAATTGADSGHGGK